MIDLPEAFMARMAEELGDESPAFFAAFSEPSARGLRENPMKRPEPDPYADAERIPWEPEGRYIGAEDPAGVDPLHEAGAWYLQEPSAMLPVAVLAPLPGERVLDLCAAPGGKSTQAAIRMRGQGTIVCSEPVAKRAQILSRNIERIGVTNAVVVSALPDQLAGRWQDGFDAVLVDAPCSGEGMFRRDPQTRAEWTPESSLGCAGRQKEILASACRMVRPGGRLVYSTCTYSRAENEDVVSAFLAEHPDFCLRGFDLPGARSESGMLTVYPHRMRGEGQFTALLVREGDGILRPWDSELPRPGKEQLRLLSDFAGVPAPSVGCFGRTLVVPPAEIPDLRGLRVLRMGLHLGEADGRRFIPDHAWAVSWTPPVLPRVPVSEEAALRYQAGETLPCGTERGYVLPAYRGLPLGFGKVSDGVLKNHYPKGLRRPFRGSAAQ